MSCDWKAESLLSAAQDKTEFFRYCAGVAHEMLTRFDISHGLEIHITDMDLPLKKGVSSSAAVCILITKAFHRYFKLRLFPYEIMDIAYRGERMTGSRCGRMDQACIYGKTPVLLMFEKGKDCRIEPIFPGDDIHLLFVDLAGQKDTIQILSHLQIAYPGDSDIQNALGKQNEDFVRSACCMIQDGDAQGLGQLMCDAQQVFDNTVARHSPKQLTAPLLHKLLDFQDVKPHLFGGKGVGSQGDGTAQFVAKTSKDREIAMAKIHAAFPDMRCFSLSIKKANS